MRSRAVAIDEILDTPVRRLGRLNAGSSLALRAALVAVTRALFASMSRAQTKYHAPGNFIACLPHRADRCLMHPSMPMDAR